jgi:hypothetical protein
MRLVPLERRQKLTQNRLWNDLIQLCYEGEKYVTSFSCWIKTCTNVVGLLGTKEER